MEQQSIFNYTDYRSFLKAHFRLRKQNNSRWSYGQWAKQLGFTSTAVLTNILSGKRHPGEESLSKLKKYFAWSEKEQEYFDGLVSLQKNTNNPILMSCLLERLRSINPQKKFNFLDDKAFQLFSNPLYVVLREMVQWPHFREDVDWIQSQIQFDCKKPDIKRALTDLCQLGLLRRDDSGFLQYSDATIDTKPDVSGEAVKLYHERMAEHAKSSVRKTKVEQREISGMAICMDQKEMAEAKKMIRRFREEFIARFENPSRSSHVYQFNLQFFPLAGVEVQVAKEPKKEPKS